MNRWYILQGPILVYIFQLNTDNNNKDILEIRQTLEITYMEIKRTEKDTGFSGLFQNK